jgi:ribosomal protein S12 methylthiotransferase
LKTLGLISLGCAKNRVDAEHLLGDMAGHGFQLVEDLAAAEVIVVNTCGFIREAAEESIEEILKTAGYKQEGACRTLVVAGCLPKRYPDLPGEMPEVDYFFTPDDLPRIPSVLGGRPRGEAGLQHPRVLTQFAHSAYLKIADGCSNRCTYCTIPSIRGSFRSGDESALVAEAEMLAGRGVVELNLVAQDVTSYGEDRGDGEALARLLRRLEAVRDLRWIRLLYAYPRALPPGLVEILASGGKVVPYLDVPVQHISPPILQAMGRKGSPRAVEDVLAGLAAAVPGLVLRTTAIVGFPGEKERDFRELADFVERVRFHHLGVFTYSPEEGTPAHRLRPRVSRRVAEERRERLLELQVEISAARNREFVGRELDLLLDGIDEEGRVVGRTYGQAPEVDGHTLVADDRGGVVEVGSFVRARIIDAHEYDLVAQLVP